jgi:hypothetical protein
LGLYHRTAVDKITGSITPDDDVVEESVMLSLFNSEITTVSMNLEDPDRLPVLILLYTTGLGGVQSIVNMASHPSDRSAGEA